MSEELVALYVEAEQNNIEVCDLHMQSLTAISAPCKDGYVIGLNDDKLITEEQRTVCLAHEIGHCKTGGFYNIDTGSDQKARVEERASAWAYRRLIPFCRLKNLIGEGRSSPEEIAKEFGVTEEFALAALRYYNI